MRTDKIKTVIAAHDKLFKTLYETPALAVDIFRIVLPKNQFKLYDWGKLRLEKDSFADGRRADLIYSVPILGFSDTRTLIFIILEHKSSSDPKLFWQLYKYQDNLLTNYYAKHKYIPQIIPVVFYHGKKPWTQPLDFQQALREDFFKKNPSFAPEGVINFKLNLLNIQDPKMKRVFEDPSFESRGGLFLLRNVWSAKPDVAFVKKVFSLFGEFLRKREDLVLAVLEYLSTAYKMKPETWKAAERSAVELGLLEKGGYMNVREYIRENARAEGRQEGRQEGMQAGMQAGRQEGMQAGRQEGMQAGMQKGIKSIIFNMLKKNAKISFISEMTGMPEEEIKKLQNGK